MPRNLPETLAFTFQREVRALTLTTESEGVKVFETECPTCLGTLSIKPSNLRAHRDETMSTKSTVSCGDCSAGYMLDHSVLGWHEEDEVDELDEVDDFE